jgi:hypothetical protein
MSGSAELLYGGTIPHEETAVHTGPWQQVYRREFRDAASLLLPDVTGLAADVFTAPNSVAGQAVHAVRESLSEAVVQNLVSGHIRAGLTRQYGQLSSGLELRAKESAVISEHAQCLTSSLGLDPESAATDLFEATRDALAGQAGISRLKGSLRRKDGARLESSLAAIMSCVLQTEAGEKLSRFALTGSRSAAAIDTALTGLTEAIAAKSGSIMDNERAISTALSGLRQKVAGYLFGKNKYFHTRPPYEKVATMVGHLAAEAKLPGKARLSMSFGELHDAFFPPRKAGHERTMFVTYQDKPGKSGFRVVTEKSGRFDDKPKGPRRPDWKRIGQTAMLLFFATGPFLSACAPQPPVSPESPLMPEPSGTPTPFLPESTPILTPAPDDTATAMSAQEAALARRAAARTAAAQSQQAVPTQTEISETPTPEYESLWDVARVEWSSGVVSGQCNGTAVQIQIDIDHTLFNRSQYPIRGFNEYKGKFEDVANSTACALSLRPQGSAANTRLIEVPLVLKDGVWAEVYYETNPQFSQENTTQEVRTDVPVRFIYGNGDTGFVLPLKTGEGYSRAWGVDPETGGLLVFMGNLSMQAQNPDQIAIDGGMREVLYVISKTKFGNNVYNEAGRRLILMAWFNNDIERSKVFPVEGGTLRPIIP